MASWPDPTTVRQHSERSKFLTPRMLPRPQLQKSLGNSGSPHPWMQKTATLDWALHAPCTRMNSSKTGFPHNSKQYLDRTWEISITIPKCKSNRTLNSPVYYFTKLLSNMINNWTKEIVRAELHTYFLIISSHPFYRLTAPLYCKLYAYNYDYTLHLLCCFIVLILFFILQSSIHYCLIVMCL